MAARGPRGEAVRLYSEGIAHSQEGRLSEAITCYTAAASEDPIWSLPLLNWGVALLQRGDAKIAVEVFERGLPLASDKAEQATFLSNMGQAHYKAGNLEKALKSYRLSLEKREAATTWVEIALVWHDLGQNDKAVDYLRRYLAAPAETLYPTAQIRALLKSYGG